MKSSRSIFIVAAFVAAIAVGGIALALRSFTAASPAPDVAYTMLNGSTSSFKQLRGKVVLVNFWATSCTTCVQEMPKIVAMHEKYAARGYETVAVAMSYDTPAYVVNFAQTRKLPFNVAIDKTGEIAKRFGDVTLTPTSVLIDKRGEIVKRFVGEPDFVALHELVEKLLAET